MAAASSSRAPSSKQEQATASFFRPRLWVTKDLPEPISRLPAHFQDLIEVAAELEAGQAPSARRSAAGSQPLLLGSPVKRAAPRRPVRGEVRQSCTCRRRHVRKASCAETLRRINSKLWAQKVMEGAISSEIRSFLSRNRQVTSLPELREALNQSPEARRRPAQVFDSAADAEAAASAVVTSPMEEDMALPDAAMEPATEAEDASEPDEEEVELPPAETTQPEEAAVTAAASSDAALQLAEEMALPDAAMEPATEAEDASEPDEDATVPDAAMEPVPEAEDATQPDEASEEPRSSDRDAETVEKAPAPLELLTCS